MAAYFVELKAKVKAPTPLQRHEHETLRALGHTVLVIDKIGTFMPSRNDLPIPTSNELILYTNTPKCAVGQG